MSFAKFYNITVRTMEEAETLVKLAQRDDIKYYQMKDETKQSWRKGGGFRVDIRAKSEKASMIIKLSFSEYAEQN